MAGRRLLRSFAGGEIAPELFGRIDLDKMQTGLAQARNFQILPHGPAANRPGLQFVNEAKNSAQRVRLIPFAYSADQTMVLEFGAGYIRFHTQGQTLLRAAQAVTGITAASPGVLSYVGTDPAAGALVYLSGTGAPELDGRFVVVTNRNTSANTFQLFDQAGRPIDTRGLTIAGGSMAVVYEVTTPYTEPDLPALHYAQSADVLTIVHPAHQPRELRRLGATNWQLSTITFAPAIEAPGAPTVVTTVEDDKDGDWKPEDQTYLVTAVSASTMEESLASPIATVRNDLTIKGNYNEITPSGVLGAVRYNVYKLATGGLFGYIGQSVGAAFRDDNIVPDVTQTPPEGVDPFLGPGRIVGVRVTNGGSGYGTSAASGGEISDVIVQHGGDGYLFGSTTLRVADKSGTGATFTVDAGYMAEGGPATGSINSVTVTNGGARYTRPTFTLSGSGTGARLLAVLEQVTYAYPTLKVTDSGGGSGAELYPVVAGGKIVDVTVLNTGSGYVNPVVSVLSAAGGGGATFATPVLSSVGAYPSTVTYIEQRRVFGATDARPQTIWMTRSATESNLTQSVPVRDDDAIILTLKGTQQNRIRHLVPLGDLLALTAGGEFRIYAADTDVLTPASATPKAQSFIGANNVQPAIAESAVLYAQAIGGHMREFAYSGESLNGATFANNDISVLAPHLFDGFDIVDIAFSRTSTCPTCWAVRSDGLLLGLTYVPGQNVRAWHRHDTAGGVFESVCCVAEGGEEVLYALVRRTIDGRPVRYIERLHTRQFADQADAFFVDSGLTYRGAPTTRIGGLWHLEGRPVAVLADGAVVEGCSVVGGWLTPELPAPASVVHVGLPIEAELQTLPLSYQADEAFGQGVMKNVNEVHLRVARSGAMQVGPTGGRMVEAKRRTTEPYGTAPRLRTGWDHLVVAPRWDDDAGVTVRHDLPLPLTVLALVLDVTAGG